MEELIDNELRKAKAIKVVAWVIFIPVILIFAGALDLAIAGFKDPTGTTFLLMALYCLAFVCVIGSIIIKPAAKLNYSYAVMKIIFTFLLFILPVVGFFYVLHKMAGID